METPSHVIEKWLDTMKNLAYDVFTTCAYEFDEASVIRDTLNNDCDREVLIDGNLVHDRDAISGQGSFTFRFSDDYFEGEFHGSVRDRYGHLTKFSDGGCVTCGYWENGHLEV